MEEELQNLLETYADMIDVMKRHGYRDKGVQAEIAGLLCKALTDGEPFSVEDMETKEEPFLAEMEKEGKRSEKVIRFPGAFE